MRRTSVPIQDWVTLQIGQPSDSASNGSLIVGKRAQLVSKRQAIFILVAKGATRLLLSLLGAAFLLLPFLLPEKRDPVLFYFIAIFVPYLLVALYLTTIYDKLVHRVYDQFDWNI
mmetsp:Transcript_16511/g.28046  ORF Transcript_16511/g.28046 Transcript_16511/m.28046 type:complete len:115 (-) Transcript_16511:27-371(-)